MRRVLIGLGLVLLLWLCALLAPASRSAESAGIDTALVLLADVSISMDASERTLQREGYRRAFEARNVWNRVREGECKAVAVRYGEFSERPFDVTGWQVINSYESSVRFGELIARGPEPYGVGAMTGVGRAMLTARDWLDELPGEHRRVIDISADGYNNAGPSPREARAAINPDGLIQINGLPLLINTADPDSLLAMFREDVISGPGGFMVALKELKDLATAIEIKLAMEMV